MILHMTGHPFIDIGLATLAAMAGKTTLSDLTQDDLNRSAQTLKMWFTRHGAIRPSYASMFFPNSPFWQSKITMSARDEYASQMLFSFLADRTAENNEEKCVYFNGLKAQYRVHRQHVPMLNADEVWNFSSSGHYGLPVSGLALLAIHAMPFGCLKCGGKILAIHQLTVDSSNPANITMLIARKNLERNRQIITLLPADEVVKYPDFGGEQRVRFITQLISIRDVLRARNVNFDHVTGYYFSNVGNHPHFEILELDHSVMSFVDKALLNASSAWQQAVARNWLKGKKGELEETDEERIASGRQNRLYEQLFRLPDNPHEFLSSLKKASNWRLVTIFLKEVLLMEQKRIDTYKKLGDLLTDYALRYENQPHSFYYAFSRAKNYTALRGVIQSAALKMYKSGTDHVLFTFDDFVLAFEHPSERYSQWRLARDLISIRMLELLHQNKIDLSELQDEKIDLTLLNQEEETV